MTVRAAARPAICIPEGGGATLFLRKIRRPAVNDGFERHGPRHEYARPPGDDLDGASHAPERRQVCVRRPLDLDPVAAHEAPASEPPAVGKGGRFSPLHDGLEGFRVRHGRTPGQAEARAHRAHLFGVAQPADERHTVIRGEPVHAHVLDRQ